MENAPKCTRNAGMLRYIHSRTLVNYQSVGT